MTPASWKGRCAYITGATGFVGTHLTRALVARGARVVALVCETAGHSPLFYQDLSDRVTLVRGDVEDSAAAEHVLREHAVDTVFHLAAQALVGTAAVDPLRTFETNVRGAWCLLDACRRHGRTERIVLASSVQAAGGLSTLPTDDGQRAQKCHPYDVSKRCADLIAAAYHDTYGLPIAITWCGNVYGPGDVNFSRIVPGTVRSALRGERPVIRSDGSPRRDYVHVAEVAEAYLLLAERLDGSQVRGRTFSFATGELVSVLELTKLILKAAGREDLQPILLNRPVRETAARQGGGDLARRLLGWRPGRTTAARMADTVAWYREYFRNAPADRNPSARMEA